MIIDEVIISILGKSTLACPEIDQQELRSILVEVLYKYDIRPQETALVPITDIQDKILMYLATKKLDGLSARTLYNYKLNLIRLSNYIHKNIQDINTMDIRIYLATRSREQSLKSTSLNTEISILKSFFNWLENEEYIHRSPTRKIKQPKIEKRLRKALNAEELERLRDACITSRQRALLEFIFATGARLSEIANVNIRDIDWNACSLHVIGKGNKEREVFFTTKSRLYLKKYIGDRINSINDEPLFISSKRPYHRLGGRAIEKEINKIAAAAGFDKAIFPHLLRHTMATLALQSGASLTTVQKLLGHSDPATTEIYAEIGEDTVKEEYKKHLIQ